MNYKTIQRSSTSELVIEEILRSVHSGELQPGDKLPPERELTKMFGVGRSTLREAISALVLVGYLEVVQGRGTFLKKELPSVTLSASDLSEVHTAANIMDLVEVREILECNAVKLAAHRADPNDIQRLSAVLAQMEATVDDIKQFSEHDFEFHITLARATGNEMILEMMKLIVTKVHEQYERFSSRTLFRTDQAVATAAQIVTSVADGDGEQASKLMQKHLNLVTTELKRMVPDAGKG